MSFLAAWAAAEAADRKCTVSRYERDRRESEIFSISGQNASDSASINCKETSECDSRSTRTRISMNQYCGSPKLNHPEGAKKRP